MIGGSVLFLGFEGVRLTPEERRLLARVEPAGLVLFARNVGTSEELLELVRDLRGLLPRTILAVDSEGGRVDRLRAVVAPAPPAAGSLAARRRRRAAPGAGSAPRSPRSASISIWRRSSTSTMAGAAMRSTGDVSERPRGR